ncbi:MAG: hypothetical protein FJ254_09265 [Phycisphaerae bacterium]|nr:hypothetical protein [Phycisphaerae bacterium]
MAVLADDSLGPHTNDALLGAAGVAVVAIALAWLLRRTGLRHAAVAAGVVTGIMLGPAVLAPSAPAAFVRWIDGGADERVALRDAERLVEARRAAMLHAGRPPTASDPAAAEELATVVRCSSAVEQAQTDFAAPRRWIVLALAALAILGAMSDPGPRQPIWQPTAFTKGAWLAVVPMSATLICLALVESERGTPMAFALAACTGCAAVAAGTDRALVYREETTGPLAHAARFATMLSLVPLIIGLWLVSSGTIDAQRASFVAVAACVVGLLIHGAAARTLERACQVIILPALSALLIVSIDLRTQAHWITTGLVALGASDGRWLGAWIGARSSGALDGGSPSRTALAAQGATVAQLGFAGILASTMVLPSWGIVMLVLGALYLDVTGTLRFAAAGSLRAADDDA